MDTEFVILIIFVYIVSWIFFGYLLSKDKRITAQKFAFIFALGLGFLKLFLSLSLLSPPVSIIIGSILFLVGLGIGYPVAYYLFHKKIQNHR